MKTRLPKTLLIALLSAICVSTAYANTTTKVMKPFDIIEINSATTADGNILERLQVGSQGGYAAIVKDGQGTLTIKNNATVNNTFIVREGETIVTDGATIKSTQAGDSMLMVGGNGAKLTLDGATYQTTKETGGNNSIVIGGRDGDGTLHLTNGAVLENHHCLFVGGQSRSAEWDNNWSATFQHVCGSYADATESALYRNSENFTSDIPEWQNEGQAYTRLQSKGTVTVDGGSKLYVGYGMNFNNADIVLTGKGTELIEGCYRVSAKAAGYASGWGDAVYGGTTVTITDGATLTANNNLLISYYGGKDAPEINGGFNGDTVVTIGKGGTLNSLRYTYIGEESYMAKTTFTVQDGGTANITHATLGISTAGTATGTASDTPTAVLNINKGGTYTGSSLTLAKDSVVTNEGSIALADGTMVLESENGITTEKENIASEIQLNGGTLINNGTIKLSDGSLQAEKDSKLVLGENSQLSAKSITFESGATVVVEAGGSSAPISITNEGHISDREDVTFEVSMGKGVNTNAKLNSKETNCNGAEITFTIATGVDAFMTAKLKTATENASGIWESTGEASWTCHHADKTTGIFTKVRMVKDIVVSEKMALNMNITDMEDGTQRSLTVKDAKVELNGANSYTGNTTINGENAELKLGSANALGSSVVYLQNKGTLDLSGFAIANTIYVEGCTLSGGANYAGDMYVSGNLSLTEATKAKSVTMSGAGSIADECLHTNKLTVEDNATGEISSDLVMGDNSTITIGANTKLVVSGSMTLGSGIQVIVDESFQNGDVVIDYTGSGADLSNTPLTLVTPSGQEVSFVITGDQVILNMNPYSQLRTDILAQGNWGIAMASRAFVNAVQGQHNNMGCIANGRGTVWAGALFGDYSIDGSGAKSGSDITMYGAAVGADMKIGKRSNVGIALGYTDSEVSLDTKPHKVDQEGTYVAVYGDHGLRKLSDKSCLSFNWVAAYGNTESSFRSTDWEQDHVQINGRLNWNRKVTDRLCMNVFGGLEYFASESGSVDDGKSGSIQNLRGEVGVGAAYVAWGTPDVTDGKGGLVSHGCKRLVLNGELSYSNDMLRNNPTADVHGYRGTGANPGRQGFGAKAGATYRFGQRWSASANYSFNAMDDAHEHNVNVGAAYTF